MVCITDNRFLKLRKRVWSSDKTFFWKKISKIDKWFESRLKPLFLYLGNGISDIFYIFTCKDLKVDIWFE